MKVNLVAPTEIWEVAAALQVGEFGVRIELVDFFPHGTRQRVLIEDVHNRHRLDVVQLVRLHVRVDTVKRQSRGQVLLRQAVQLSI